MLRGLRDRTRRGRLAALATLAAPSAAELPPVTIGMGEQNPEMFQDARFLATGIRNARLIVP